MSEYPYRLISWLVLPVWIAHTVWRSVRDGGMPYLRQRFGIYSAQTNAVAETGRTNLWIHAASVGEVNTVAPLIRQLHNDYPHFDLLLTTVTPTGRQIAESSPQLAGIENLSFTYLPLDYRASVRRFLTRYCPDAALIVETEIWPTLYDECSNNGITLVIVNARVSQRTRRITKGLASRLLAPAITRALSQVSGVLAKSQEDADGFRALLEFRAGATTTGVSNQSTQIQVCGNLKRLQQALPPTTNCGSVVAGSDSKLQAVLAARDTVDPRVCLLASTHEDEELQLASEWLKQKRKELLVIVPRHPERGKKIESRLKKLGCHCIRRSQGLHPDAKTDVYIADTLGELQDFYRISPVVFVGGSVVAVGGHNILEPASHGCAIVVGPHMHNFAEEFSQLDHHQAIVQRTQAADVVETLCDLLDNQTKRDSMCQQTLAALQQNDQSVDSANQFSADTVRRNYLYHLERWLKP